MSRRSNLQLGEQPEERAAHRKREAHGAHCSEGIGRIERHGRLPRAVVPVVCCTRGKREDERPLTQTNKLKRLVGLVLWTSHPQLMLCLRLAWKRNSGILGASHSCPPAVSALCLALLATRAASSPVIEISLLLSELTFPPLIQSGITSPFNLGNKRPAAEPAAPD